MASTSLEVPSSAPIRPRRNLLGWIGANAGLLLLGLVFVLPLTWLLSASVDKNASWTVEIPHFTLDNFRAAMSGVGMAPLWNSVLMSLIATAISTVPAAFGAYALSRYRLPLRRTMLIGVLFLSGLPISIIVIPVYQIYSERGWLALVPTALFLGVTSLPIELWLIKGFIDELPINIEEAARVEGVSNLSILGRIVVPLTLPGITAAALFGFINAWGALLVPLILIPTSSQEPAALVFPQFMTDTHVLYGEIAAYSLIYALPVIVLYLFVARLFRGRFNLAGSSG
jgi:multiple sugar transport system permease protein